MYKFGAKLECIYSFEDCAAEMRSLGIYVPVKGNYYYLREFHAPGYYGKWEWSREGTVSLLGRINPIHQPSGLEYSYSATAFRLVDETEEFKHIETTEQIPAFV